MQNLNRTDQATIVPPISEKLPTKEVKGLTLVWSPEDLRYVLPLTEPEKAKFKILFDEQTDTFIQVMVNNPDFYYRDRKVTSPDGATFQEKIFIGKTPQGDPIELPDPKVQMAINQARKLELKRLFIENLIAAQGAVYLGLILSVGFFFYYLITGLPVVAESFTTGSLLAMHEVGYYFAWVLGLIVGGFILKYTVPALLSARSKSPEPDLYATASPGSGSGNAGASEASVNITVTQNSGAGNRAQSFVNDRDL